MVFCIWLLMYTPFLLAVAWVGVDNKLHSATANPSSVICHTPNEVKSPLFTHCVLLLCHAGCRCLCLNIRHIQLKPCAVQYWSTATAHRQ